MGRNTSVEWLNGLPFESENITASGCGVSFHGVGWFSVVIPDFSPVIRTPDCHPALDAGSIWAVGARCLTWTPDQVRGDEWGE